MLKQFGFRRKMLYICIAKRREPVNTGFSPLFFCKNRAKMGCFTKHVGKSTCLRKISTCFSGFFSGQVGAQIDDIESRKVKRYLFSNLHFFVTTQVAPDSESKCGTAVCVVSFNTNRNYSGRSRMRVNVWHSGVRCFF